MNLSEIYNQLVDGLRFRHNRSSEPWNNILKSNNAKTLYPNIAAEMVASGYFKSTVSQYARITPDILMGVIENAEDLTVYELHDLTKLWGCEFGYLACSNLQVVDPNTNRGKCKKYRLCVLIDQLSGLDYFNKAMVYATYETLCRGQIITSAQYRWAIRALNDAIRAKQQIMRYVRCVPIGG